VNLIILYIRFDVTTSLFICFRYGSDIIIAKPFSCLIHSWCQYIIFAPIIVIFFHRTKFVVIAETNAIETTKARTTL
jgi:hypothetical protein